MTLTGKQARFVTEYVNSLNGTQAAIAAGYSRKTARAIASENLGKPSIKQEIAHQQALRQTRLNATRELVLQELVKIVDFKLSELYDEDDNVLPMRQWPREATSVVESFKYGPRQGPSGHMRMSLKLYDRTKALEMIGDMVGAFNRRKNVKRLPEK